VQHIGERDERLVDHLARWRFSTHRVQEPDEFGVGGQNNLPLVAHGCYLL
jgi:hypothetical protein